MDNLILKGKVHAFGNDINTDVIIPGKYTKTLSKNDLAAHVLEDLDPHFRKNVKHGDILAAGDNFGCGSSREQAPLALLTAGVTLVIARYFARIFFRNAINIGLAVMEVPELEVQSGDIVEADLIEGILYNTTSNRRFKATPLPTIMVDVLREGGLVEYLRKNGNYLI